MPRITLDLSNAVELAETLTFLADWLSGSQTQILSPAAWPPSSATPPTTPTLSALICTGLSSSSA